MFTNSKNVHELKTILKFQETVHELQNSLLIHKIIAGLKIDHHFSKCSINQKSVCEFQKLFNQFPKTIVNSKNVHRFKKITLKK